MRLSKSAVYALHAVTFLAGRGQARAVPAHAIARAQGLPEDFLMKALRPLVRAGLLLPRRGPGGGYRLARPPREISLLDVVQAVDGPLRGEAPLDIGRSPDTELLNRRLAEACEQAAAKARRRLQEISVWNLARVVK